MQLVYIHAFLILLVLHQIYGVTYNCTAGTSCGCSTVSSVSVNQRIVGGEIAQDRAWGWMVSLQLSSIHICGATLITSEYAITAAHCVSSYLNLISRLSILAGTNYLSRPVSGTAQRRSITEIYVHPRYNTSTSANDIALVKFNALSTENITTLKFVCLPPSGSDSVAVDDNLVATGWGYTSEGSGFASDSLRQVTLINISPSNTGCQAILTTSSSTELCAGVLAGGKDTCQGDSGGPLMKFQNNQWVIVGITSTGNGCARPNLPGKYTRVSSYITYINEVTSGRLSPTASLTSTSSSSSSSSTTTQTTTKKNHGDVLCVSLSFFISVLVFSLFH